jgi:hypothetical protein
MTLDRVLAVLGTVLALPGFFLAFFTTQQTVAAICVLLAAVIGLAAALVHYYAHLPPFHVRLLESVVQISDAGGKHADVKRTYTARSNYRQQTIMVHKNIAADGDVINITWDGKPIPTQHIEPRMKEWEVTIHFDFPLRQWADFVGTLGYEVTDSFLGNPEGVIYSVEHITRRAVLRVHLPNDRPCLTAKAYIRTGSGEDPIDGLQVLEGNKKLELELRRPRRGSQYAIYWTW